MGPLSEGGRGGGGEGGREKYIYITQIMTDSGGRTVLHRERNTHNMYSRRQNKV